jgi:hypothetical protein
MKICLDLSQRALQLLQDKLNWEIGKREKQIKRTVIQGLPFFLSFASTFPSNIAKYSAHKVSIVGLHYPSQTDTISIFRAKQQPKQAES